MAHRYRVHFFCEECSVPHPLGMSIERDELLWPDQAIGDVYDGRKLPEEIVELYNHQVRCPETGKTFVLPDNRQVFLELLPEAAD
jgi:hypothetical protein